MAMNTYEVIKRGLVKAKDEESAKKKLSGYFGNIKLEMQQSTIFLT